MPPKKTVVAKKTKKSVALARKRPATAPARRKPMVSGGIIGDVAEAAANAFMPGSGPVARKAINLAGNGLAWVKDQIKSIVGSGDYTIGGDSPKYNVLVNNDQIPRFNPTTRGFTVSHREYVGQVTSSAVAGAYELKRYKINPMSMNSMPWLCRIASMYQKYKFHGLVFEYRTMSGPISGSTNTALGTVALAFSPNPAEAPPRNKIDLEQYEGVVSVKPSESCLCAVECDPTVRQYNTMQVQPDFIREGLTVSSVAADHSDLSTFMTDWGQLWVATAGIQGAGVQLGELWVSYSVELFAQRQDHQGCLRSAFGAVYTADAGATCYVSSLNSTGVPIANIVPLLNSGTRSFKLQITLPPGFAGGLYQLSLEVKTYAGGSTTVTAGAVAVATNLAVLPLLGPGGGNFAQGFVPVATQEANQVSQYHLDTRSSNPALPIVFVTDEFLWGGAIPPAFQQAGFQLTELNQDLLTLL